MENWENETIKQDENKGEQKHININIFDDESGEIPVEKNKK